MRQKAEDEHHPSKISKQDVLFHVQDSEDSKLIIIRIVFQRTVSAFALTVTLNF